MPDLPTLTVTAAQLERLIAVFPGETNAEKADAYREWLRVELRRYVLKAEMNVLQAEQAAERAAATEATIAELP